VGSNPTATARGRPRPFVARTVPDAITHARRVRACHGHWRKVPHPLFLKPIVIRHPTWLRCVRSSFLAWVMRGAGSMQLDSPRPFPRFFAMSTARARLPSAGRSVAGRPGLGPPPSGRGVARPAHARERQACDAARADDLVGLRGKRGVPAYEQDYHCIEQWWLAHRGPSWCEVTNGETSG
jgi:hypothetical protein